jgi:hypothetical protein
MSLQYIDWQAVYSYYISNEKINYPDCASHFNISIDSVKKKGAEENWTSKKQQVLKAALNLTEQRTISEIAKRNEEHAKMGRALQGISLEALATNQFKPKSFEDIRRGLETGIKLERQSLGLDRKETPSVEIANNKGQMLRIMWGDSTPLGDFAQHNGHLELIKSYD